MNVKAQIQAHIDSLAEPKRTEILQLHQRVLELSPTSQLWFYDGKDEEGKTVSNPNIGYGHQILTYADGKTKEFYRVGISATKTGISVYILGIDDKTFLMNSYGSRIGKATVSGYCIKFKKLKDIHLEVLDEAISYGLTQVKQ